MEIKKCEFCDKLISDVSIHKDTICFCDQDCLTDYCKEYANDSDSYEKEHDDIRMDLDWNKKNIHIIIVMDAIKNLGKK